MILRLTMVAAALAVSIGCGSASTPPSPSAALRSAGETRDPEATLKVVGPTPVSPVNDAVVESASPTLIVTAAKPKFGASLPLTNEFELYDAGVRVRSEIVTATSWKINGLAYDSRYTWRVRARLDAAAGPWASASFITPSPSFVVSGQIVSGADGQPVAGATLRVDGVPATVADSAGRFSIALTDSTIRRVMIAAGGFVTRETYLRGSPDRTCLDLDLIPAASPLFLMYREMAHNAKDSPLSLAPIRRWTTSPNFTLAATWKDTTEPVDPTVLQHTANLIRDYVPIWTDGRFSAGAIEVVPAWVPPTRVDWIQVYWVHDSFRGMAGTGSNPGFMHFNVATTQEPAVIIHELGHAMGYHHSSTVGAIMGGTLRSQTALAADELRVVRMLYGRSPGNLDFDVDPTDLFSRVPSGPGTASACR